jgi:hypothetical protein
MTCTPCPIIGSTKSPLLQVRKSRWQCFAHAFGSLLLLMMDPLRSLWAYWSKGLLLSVSYRFHFAFLALVPSPANSMDLGIPELAPPPGSMRELSCACRVSALFL